MDSDLVTTKTLIYQQKKLIATYQEYTENNFAWADLLLKLCTGLEVLEELAKKSRQLLEPDFG